MKKLFTGIRGCCTTRKIIVIAVVLSLFSVHMYAKDITVILDWVPNTNHAGLYLALDKGYFAQEGLNVTITQPSELGSDALVASGAGEFGVSNQEAVTFARTADAPVPVVAIAAILQHNTSGYAVPSRIDIQSPRDLSELRYGGWGTEYEEAVLTAVLEPYSLSADTVKIVNIGTMDVLAAFKRHIDFAWIFYGWDGIRAEIDNITLTYLPLIEIDSRLDYYTPMFITSERMIAEEADTVRRFLRAVSRSYAEVITNPAAAARILVSQVPEIDSELARRSLEYLEPYFQADADYWGKMDLAVWQRFSTFLQDLLPRPLDARKAFTNRFLPQNTP